jgi:GTP-binding protein
MADVGLVGFPNAGKSSLLTAFTNARPKIAPYPFTTIIPNLGVLRVDDENDIIVADIPGIIEGASEGLGLGDTFLKHITRTSCLIFMVDCSDDNYLSAYDTLCDELKNYSDDLLEKPRIVLCNKIDVEGSFERAIEIENKIKESEPETRVIPVSVLTGRGMKDARNEIIELVSKLENRNQKNEDSAAGFNASYSGNSENGASGSSFMATRAYIEDDDDVQYPGSEQ